MSFDLALLLFALVPAVLFCVIFGTRVRWWDNAGGRHLFFFTAALAALIARSVWLRFDTDTAPPASGFLRTLVLVIGVLLWQRLWLLIRGQWLDRNGNGDHK